MDSGDSAAWRRESIADSAEHPDFLTEGQQPSLAQQGLGRAELRLPADERREVGGQVVASHCPQRREVGGLAGDAELEETLVLREVLEAVLAEV